MKKICFYILTFLIALSLQADDVVIVINDPDVFKFKGGKNDGIAHADGIASLDFQGRVIEQVDGDEIPLSGVKFSVEKDRSFANSKNKKIIFLSNDEGKFLAKLYVGAAFTMGGKTPGRVYQTKRSKLRIEKEGYKTVFLWFDYKMPKVIIIMVKKGNPQQKQSRD